MEVSMSKITRILGSANRRLEVIGQEVAANLSNKNLARVMCVLSLENTIVRRETYSGAANRMILASTLEAIFGAMWVDSRNLDKILQAMRKIGLA